MIGRRRGGGYPGRHPEPSGIFLEKADALQRKVKGAMTYPPSC